ncbi:efflux RND transporter permease subunit [Limibacillus halophilus]|uniref:Efflux pump membrane transporter n=1 Tax=Limibacillus halophilus TaxID=1579333 RepID=A0A839SRZ5_9PROT|nr:multidrug efflux RND transporter permease subunit [Limibacillus halophilus]MBB3065647.1 HAE1 family hydrophobic/amphiphilic exporter-1 [Limibacillus halophilus]
MKIAHFSVDRPIFASVLSILIVLVGVIAYLQLPVTQYPEIAPPSVTVTANYPGATAEIAADTVASVLEQQINGVENMLYMRSENTASGTTSLTVTFQTGTDLDIAQVLVQNRVSLAEPLLPDVVQRQGIDVRKNSPDLMMVIHILSPDDTRNSLYVSNYAKTQVVDRLARINGVGEARLFAERAYAMRVWIDPERAASFNMTATEIVAALRENNVQVAAGVLNQSPMHSQDAFEVSIQTQGRLLETGEFGNIIIKQGSGGRTVRLRDVARVELGAQNYDTIGYLDGSSALPIGIFQRPGSNALETAADIIAEMEDIAESMPQGIDYRIVYNPTDYIQKSIDEIYRTIIEAVLLVILVVMLFLQSWRASIIPIIAIPVSLIGTFAVMAALDISLNNLSLFGLVLAIGIVVDDAIVVVENVEHYISKGLAPKEAAHRTMDEVGMALIAIALVLSAVFIPTAFITGISGAFFKQFALTVATATIISALVSLTLSPALAGILLKSRADVRRPPALFRVLLLPFSAIGQGFNWIFSRTEHLYGRLTLRLVRGSLFVLVLYGGLVALTVTEFKNTPTGFIPEQDQGYLIAVTQLPPGASLSRTDEVMRQAAEIFAKTPGVANVVSIVGLDGSTFTTSSSAGVIFLPLLPFEERVARGLDAGTILQNAQMAVMEIQDALSFVIAPPPVRGIGNSGGWKLYLQDLNGRGLEVLEEAAGVITAQANQDPSLTRTFTFFNTRTPRIYADIDRTRAEMLQVPIDDLIDTLEIYLGSSYVNDFNFLGRTYRVIAQAEGQHRKESSDVLALRTRSADGSMVPLGTVASLRDTTGPVRLPRYNLYPAIDIQGSAAPGISTGEAIGAVEALMAESLPDGIGFEWTELALQEKLAGNTALIMFGMAVVFVFLLLSALYESWLLPLAVILIVPMCLLAAVVGVNIRGLDNNLLVQIGFVVLIGLAAKNAILIVEFAKQAEENGLTRREAAVEAAQRRLRPILMTSFAFILGVVPLLIASGAGAEMRQSLGTAVFSGMLGVTFFGLIFTPVFYVTARWIGSRLRSREEITTPV